MSSPDLTKASAMELSIGHRASRPAPAQLGGRALFLLLILDLSYFINAMDRQVFAVLLPDIKWPSVSPEARPASSRRSSPWVWGWQAFPPDTSQIGSAARRSF